MIALLLNISKNISELKNDCYRKFDYRPNARHHHGPGNSVEGWLLMNQELRQLCIDADCPEDVLDSMWFNIFIQKFSHLLLLMVEEENK